MQTFQAGAAPSRVPPLEARRVGKRYRGGTEALIDLDLEITPGSTTALVGPNGAGKTTLMKLWVGFERPTSGYVRVAGHDPWRERSRALMALGYLPQRPALYRELTVGEHLTLGAALRSGFEGDDARRRLDGLGISGARKVGELSGGEQAQVALSIALASGGRILLLDEPLASLDPLARREFLASVRDAVDRRGATVILSSHIVTDVQGWCDRIIVLGGGRVRLHDAVQQVLSAHAIGDDSADGQGHVVGRFPGAGGEPLVLLRLVDGARPGARGLRSATLEEVVIGYLAADRAGNAGA